MRNPVMVSTPSAIVALSAPPFAIYAVEGRVRLGEDQIRMPVSPDALDHEDMPVVVPGPDPRALKAGDLGRHVGRRRLHVEPVRQRDDGLGSTVSGWA